MKPASPSVEPVKMASPSVEPMKPASPFVEPVGPASPSGEPMKSTSPSVEPVKPASPFVEPVKPASPFVEPVGPASPSVELIKSTSPSVEPVKPASPSVEPMKSTSPSVGPANLSVEPMGPASPSVEPMGPASPSVETVKRYQPSEFEDVLSDNSEEFSVVSLFVEPMKPETQSVEPSHFEHKKPIYVDLNENSSEQQTASDKTFNVDLECDEMLDDKFLEGIDSDYQPHEFEDVSSNESELSVNDEIVNQLHKTDRISYNLEKIVTARNQKDMVDEESDDESTSEDDFEQSITRDANAPGVYIKKFVPKKRDRKGNLKVSSRPYDCRHACVFCKKLYSNIACHISNCHKKETAVKEIEQLKTAIQESNDENKKPLQKQLSKKQNLLRFSGDHEHNLNVIRNKKGELLIARRQPNNSSFDANEYGPCPMCLQWMKLEPSIVKHASNCDGHEEHFKKGELMIQLAILTEKVNVDASKLLLNEVFPIMTRDNTSETAQSDSLIVALGNSWLRRNFDNRNKRKYYTSSHMRGAARLLLAVKKLGGEQLKDVSMHDVLKPKHINILAIVQIIII